MKIQVSLDSQKFNKKPKKEEAVKISFRIGSKKEDMETSQIAVEVGGQGRTFCPAVFTGGERKVCMFESMQLFVLDFDEGISYREAQERAVRYDLPICFSYHTFSAKPENEKFRICFLHECRVKDKRAAEIIIRMLMRIFPECDRQCSDLSRMFYGGTGVIEQGQGTFNIVQLAISFQTYLRQSDESQFKRNLKSFAESYCIQMKKSSLSIFSALSMCEDDEEQNVDFRGQDYYIIIGEDEKSTFCGDCYMIELSHQCVGREGGPEKRFQGKNKGEYKIRDIENKTGQCRLLSEFLEGMDVGHDGRFHITTNFIHIRGGKRLFLDIIQKFGFDLPKWKETFKYTKDNSYRPQRCLKCKYSEICGKKGTLLSILRENTDRRVLTTRERQYVSLEEGERKLRDNIQKAISSPAAGLHLIRAQTALGKTEICCRTIAEYKDMRFILALQTTRLKEEVYERMKKMGVQAVMTASIDDPGFPEEVSRRIRSCYSVGISGTTQVIKKYLREHKNEENMDVLMCRRYLENRTELEDARVILTTHARLLTFPKEFLDQFTVIVDEDILQMYMFNQIIGVSTDTLQKVYRESGFEILKSRVGTILEAPEDKYGSLKPVLAPGSSFFMKEEETEGLESYGENVNDLLRAAAFVRHSDGTVNYFCPSMLQQGKYIILSATLNETMYRLYFKNMDVIAYEQPPVKYKGRLEQYTYYSLGRTDLENKYEKIREYVKSLKGGEGEIITFKKYADGTNREGLYYGNQAGCDRLKGENLVVIGTPYTVDGRYKLVAHYLGVDANRKEDFRPHRQRIEYNGYSFLHTTYKNELLREIQAYSISSELEQATGRARLLREDCTVILFSSFPCEQAQIHEEDYLEEDGGKGQVGEKQEDTQM